MRASRTVAALASFASSTKIACACHLPHFVVTTTAVVIIVRRMRGHHPGCPNITSHCLLLHYVRRQHAVPRPRLTRTCADLLHGQSLATSRYRDSNYDRIGRTEENFTTMFFCEHSITMWLSRDVIRGALYCPLYRNSCVWSHPHVGPIRLDGGHHEYPLNGAEFSGLAIAFPLSFYQGG